MSIGIYKITNPDNKIYIGQSSDIERRLKDYRRKKGKGTPLLEQSILKYGWDNHQFEILEKCKIEELNNREKHWIEFYNSLNNGLNCNKGGGGVINHQQKTKDKISKALRGKKKSKNFKEKVSKGVSKPIFQYDLQGNFIKEWKSGIEAKNKNKGNIERNIQGRTKQAGGYIWLREEDKHLLQERLDKINNYINPRIGQKRTLETRKKLSKNIKGKKKKLKQLNLLSNIKNIKEEYQYLSTNQLAEKYQVSIPTMLNFLKENKIYQFRKNYKNGSI